MGEICCFIFLNSFAAMPNDLTLSLEVKGQILQSVVHAANLIASNVSFPSPANFLTHEKRNCPEALAQCNHSLINERPNIAPSSRLCGLIPI